MHGWKSYILAFISVVLHRLFHGKRMEVSCSNMSTTLLFCSHWSHVAAFNHIWGSIWCQSCALKAAWSTVKPWMFSSSSSSQFLPPEMVISCVKTEWMSERHPDRAGAMTLPSPGIGSWRGTHVHLPIKVSRQATLLCNFIYIDVWGVCVCKEWVWIFKLFAVYI